MPSPKKMTSAGADDDDFSRSSKIEGGMPVFHRQQWWRTAGVPSATMVEDEVGGMSYDDDDN
ncbi:hypothetical protein TIFTF001_001564 [Ficus carica]|uniref:Uncharacterized protein n=1 Tax=Ficus carica TaxID=3494 RepID=A0AA87YZU0_FICCA|nr:hypothetical protein TIFTF001_001564 [Ficus carica]